MPEIPTVDAYDTGKHLAFFCPHCRRYHFHSRATVDVNHGAAHCDNLSSPFTATGYKLQVVGFAPAAVMQDIAEQDAKYRQHRR